MATAIVTGAARGIGRAAAERLRADGFEVIGIDRDDAEDLDFELEVFDLERAAEDPGALRGLCGRLCECAGDEIAVLVNNAAVQVVKPIERLDAADWRRTWAVNVYAPFALVQALAPALRRARGSVINVASVHAEVTKAGFSAYAAGKGAVVAMTRALALELAPAVRVNALLPGAVDTGMLRAGFGDDAGGLDRLAAFQPLGRVGTPEEIAAAVAFLASAQSRFMTGACVRVDGGIGACLHDPGAPA